MSHKKLSVEYGIQSPTMWGAKMYKLLEALAPTFKINVEKEIELPYPMIDGKDKLEPGEYDVELAADKENYVWTNPLTQERVAFPIDSIKDEPADETTDPNAPMEPAPGAEGVPTTPDMGTDLFGAPPATPGQQPPF